MIAQHNNRVWLLGAPDPEMELIERLLRGCGESIIYAADESGHRVHPGNAYRCPIPVIPEGMTAYAVECIDKLPVGWRRVDHHRPGDLGYGKPPKDFMTASSIGQVIDELARLGVAARIDETGAHPVIPRADMGYPIWGEKPGVRHVRHAPDGGGFAWHEWCYVAHLPPRPPRDAEEAARIAQHPSVCVCRGCTGGLYAFRISTEMLLAAAADHCLAAAYRGECPGVDPDDLMQWRAETRAAHQGRSVDDLLDDVERAREALREAPRIDLGAGPVCDMRDASDESGHHTFIRRGVPELPEAAAYERVAYLATTTDRDGRKKIVLGGHTTPETVRTFMGQWAPAQGLVDVYGDPARGFAGGYLP